MISDDYMDLGIKDGSDSRSQVVLVVKNPPANAGDTEGAGSIPGSERALEKGDSNPLQYSCLENTMDRGTWLAMVLWGRKESDMTKHSSMIFIKLKFLKKVILLNP